MLAYNQFVQISVLEDPEEEVPKMPNLNTVKPEETAQDSNEAGVVLEVITPEDIRDSAHRSNDTRLTSVVTTAAVTIRDLLARAIPKILFGCFVLFCLLVRTIWVMTWHFCTRFNRRYEDVECSEQEESNIPLLDTLEPEEIAQYDIFLSFRGEDTRETITAQLYKDLKREGFVVFKDDEDMDWGKIIKSELRKTILNSRTSVVILSKNFANSKACLFELQTMLEQSKKSNHLIFPVFYRIQPEQIKEQAKKLNFEIKEEKVSVEELKRWRAALEEVATMSGVVSQQYRSDPELIEVIIRKLNSKLTPKRKFENCSRE